MGCATSKDAVLGAPDFKASAALAQQNGMPPAEAKLHPAAAAAAAADFARHSGVASEPDAVAAGALAAENDASVPLTPVGSDNPPRSAASGGPRPSREYFGAVAPASEDGRLNTLMTLNVLDTEAEPRFDDITKLLTSIFQVPIALVSLVEKERQWFKSVQGLACSQTDRNTSFCAWTLLPQNPTVLIVEDALLDARFRDNPLVQGDPMIRFYAGAPLIASNGQRLGSLCVIDRKPRKLDAENCQLLVNFAEMVVRELEKDRLLQQQMRAQKANKEHVTIVRSESRLQEPVVVCDTSKPKWPVLYLNDSAAALSGRKREDAMTSTVFDLFSAARKGAPAPWEVYASAVARGDQFMLTLTPAAPLAGASPKLLIADFKPATVDGMGDAVPQVGIPGFVHMAGEDGDSQAGVKPQYLAILRPASPVEVQAAEAEEMAPVTPPAREKGGNPFDDVRLGPLLGKGSFGKVYRGTWNGSTVAVKTIEHSVSVKDEGDATDTPAELLEAVLTADLAHPNICQTFKHASRRSRHQYDTDESLVSMSFGSDFTDAELEPPKRKVAMETWLVLEYCDRGSLQDAIDRGAFYRQPRTVLAPLPNLAAVLATAREIAGAMAYLHELDILHGDLTGGNILLASSDKDERGFTAKVADFGLSREAHEIKTIETNTYGTVTHMCPELLTEGKLSKASDVFSFGVILWEMYCCTRPWAGLRQAQVIHKIAMQGACLQFPPGTPPPFQAFGMRCMARDKEERPTFDQALDLIDDLCDEERAGRLVPHPSQPSPAPSPPEACLILPPLKEVSPAAA